MRMEARPGTWPPAGPRSVPGSTPAQCVQHPGAQPVRIHATRFPGLAPTPVGLPLRGQRRIERVRGPWSGLQPFGPVGAPRSRWTRTTGRASVSRDTVDLSRPIPSAVRRMPGCCSQCGFSIRILSSDDRCEYCWPMGATPSWVRNFEHFQP